MNSLLLIPICNCSEDMCRTKHFFYYWVKIPASLPSTLAVCRQFLFSFLFSILHAFLFLVFSLLPLGTDLKVAIDRSETEKLFRQTVFLLVIFNLITDICTCQRMALHRFLFLIYQGNQLLLDLIRKHLPICSDDIPYDFPLWRDVSDSYLFSSKRLGREALVCCYFTTTIYICPVHTNVTSFESFLLFFFFSYIFKMHHLYFLRICLYFIIYSKIHFCVTLSISFPLLVSATIFLNLFLLILRMNVSEIYFNRCQEPIHLKRCVMNKLHLYRIFAESRPTKIKILEYPCSYNPNIANRLSILNPFVYYYYYYYSLNK